MATGQQAKGKLQKVVSYTEQLLAPHQFEDWPAAHNGLQLANSGRVTKIAAAVDASTTTLAQAVRANASLLLVHHGLFWSNRIPWVGKTYEILKQAIENDLAVYSSHLPLDAHPKFGNNAQLARALGFKKLKPFFREKKQAIGFKVAARMHRDELLSALGNILQGPVHVIAAGPAICKNIGIVSGGAGSQLALAAKEGVDTFITGEGPHWTFGLAEELGMNVFYGGHYATETFGVKALAAHLSQRFKVPWTFIDHPSGL